MKSKRLIKAALKKFESDERLSYPAADININAPLALIQVDLEARVSMLKWVLKEA